MKRTRAGIGAMLICLLPSGVLAQACPTTVAGQSMAEMIGAAGGAQALFEASTAQVVELDNWLSDLEPSRGQGIREAEIEAMRKQAVELRKANQDVADAARCYMGE